MLFANFDSLNITSLWRRLTKEHQISALKLYSQLNNTEVGLRLAENKYGGLISSRRVNLSANVHAISFSTNPGSRPCSKRFVNVWPHLSPKRFLKVS